MGIPSKFWNLEHMGFKYLSSITAYIYISGDSFFNFGIPDDYNHTGFKYFLPFQLQHTHIYIEVGIPS